MQFGVMVFDNNPNSETIMFQGMGKETCMNVWHITGLPNHCAVGPQRTGIKTQQSILNQLRTWITVLLMDQRPQP